MTFWLKGVLVPPQGGDNPSLHRVHPLLFCNAHIESNQRRLHMEGCCGRKPLLVVKRKQTSLWHLMFVERLLWSQKVPLSMIAVMEESS